MSANNVIIDFQNITIKQDGNTILSKVYFTLHESEFVYLVGDVGSGKTSFIKTINAELPLKRKKAQVVDYELSKIKKNQIPYLRRKLGIVFQDYQLLTDRNVYQNLVFILKSTGWLKKRDINKRINDVLLQTDTDRFKFKMPFELSGGEQQRVVIARSLLNSPKIILADEPTGNLDTQTSYSLVRLLMDITENGTGVIMATHQNNLLEKYPARTLKCQNGRLIEFQQYTQDTITN